LALKAKGARDSFPATGCLQTFQEIPEIGIIHPYALFPIEGGGFPKKAPPPHILSYKIMAFLTSAKTLIIPHLQKGISLPTYKVFPTDL
jgi:hypothetical protein